MGGRLCDRVVRVESKEPDFRRGRREPGLGILEARTENRPMSPVSVLTLSMLWIAVSSMLLLPLIGAASSSLVYRDGGWVRDAFLRMSVAGISVNGILGNDGACHDRPISAWT